MSDPLVAYTVLCFGSLISVIDPFAAVPIYLGLVQGDTKEGQARSALQATVTCCVVLSAFALAGTLIFNFFGITIPAFKVAGGLLLFNVAVDMMQAKHSETRSTPEEEHEAESRSEVGVIPLGLPLLAGPGSIATVMVLAGKAQNAPQRLGLHAAIVAVSLVTLVTFRSGTLVSRRLGQTGLNLIGRIMGLILAAVAIQFVLDGLREAFPRLLA